MECPHGHLRQEGQRTLAAHHRVGDDVERVVIGNERTQVQTRHVLNAIFGTNARCQLLVGTHTVAQVLNLLQELGVRAGKLLAALLVACIEHRAVGQDDAGRDHHAVAVGMHATVHARRVVDDDAAHHGRADAGRIGREHAAVGFQYLVDLAAHDTRLQRYDTTFGFRVPLALWRGVRGEAPFLPVLASHDEHRVRTTLTRKRGTSGTEGEGQRVFPA